VAEPADELGLVHHVGRNLHAPHGVHELVSARVGGGCGCGAVVGVGVRALRVLAAQVVDLRARRLDDPAERLIAAAAVLFLAFLPTNRPRQQTGDAHAHLGELADGGFHHV